MYRKVMFDDIEDAKFDGKVTCSLKNDITRALESLTIWTLIGSFYPMQKMNELKIYRGVMCHDNEE